MQHAWGINRQCEASPNKLAKIFVESEKHAEGMWRGYDAFCLIGGASPMNCGRVGSDGRGCHLSRWSSPTGAFGAHWRHSGGSSE